MSLQPDAPVRRRRKVPLSAVLVTLAVLSVAVGFAYALFASYQVQKAQIVSNTLAYSRSYADKLAEVVDIYIRSLHAQLLASAAKVATSEGNAPDIDAELQRVLRQADGAIAALHTDANGKVLRHATQQPAYVPRALSELAVAQLRAGEWVSVKNPAAPTLTLVEPVSDGRGVAAGYVALVVALGDGRGIAQVVGQADDAGGMAVYVVGRSGDVLYQRNAQAVAPGLKGISHTPQGWGKALATDDGRTLLTAYAPLRKGNWAVVTQLPLEQAMLPVRQLLSESLRSAAPVFLLILLLVGVLAYAVASPLSRLSRALVLGQGEDKDLNRLHVWYAEADTLRGAVQVVLAQHRQQMKRMNQQSMTDPLTGLMNRRALDEAIEEVQTDRSPVAVIALDLDHFKRINDTFGHAAGDQALIAVAQVLRHSLRGQDKAYRTGGEEFIALLHTSSADVAREVAQRIRVALSARPMPEGVGKVTASAGIALWPWKEASLASVLEQADEALYASKHAGRDRVTVWTEASTEQKLH